MIRCEIGDSELVFQRAEYAIGDSKIEIPNLYTRRSGGRSRTGRNKIALTGPEMIFGYNLVRPAPPLVSVYLLLFLEWTRSLYLSSTFADFYTSSSNQGLKLLGTKACHLCR